MNKSNYRLTTWGLYRIWGYGVLNF